MNAKPTVTVLGAAGFIGSYLVRHLQTLGFHCFAPSRGEDLSVRHGLGHVIYAAGLTADFRCRPLDTVEAHVCLLQRLIQQGNFASLTYLSSTRVYAGAANTDESATLAVNPNVPGDLYNLSKLMGEALCLHSGHPEMKVARLSNVVGLRRDPDIFIDQLLAEGRANGKIVFRTDLESRKDYLLIDDAVELIARIALSSESGIFNVASGEAVSNRQIAEALKTEMGFTIEVSPHAASWDFTAVNVKKIKAQFGFSAQRFADYFPAYLQRYRQHKEMEKI
jgi:nucleoside-diphosphate-sugar epimerase